jgi:hypothetical protein
VAQNSVYMIAFACHGADLREGYPGMPSYTLDEPRRTAVLHSIVHACAARSWRLRAADVGSTHIFAVVEGAAEAAELISALKLWASRALRRLGLDNSRIRRWASRGIAMPLMSPAEVSLAITSVLDVEDELAPLRIARAA